ncbi:MAG: hypothetical protein PHN61_06360 [Methanothrix sp.]|nr:hypothetical protein [Methanothrix sp.]
MKSDASCKAAIKAYEEAIAIGEGLLDKIDWIKIEDSNLESEQASALSNVREENTSTKDKMIELLNRQLSLHPRRSFAAVVIIFIASGFINAFLKNIYDQLLGPYVLQFLKNIGT